MRKPLSPFSIALFLSVVGTAGCGQGTPSNGTAPGNAAGAGAAGQAEAAPDVLPANMPEIDVMNEAYPTSNSAETSGPRSQSGSQPDHARPKNQTFDQ
jgi:hypothetical protein